VEEHRGRRFDRWVGAGGWRRTGGRATGSGGAAAAIDLGGTLWTDALRPGRHCVVG
jgi:hypothetical protein